MKTLAVLSGLLLAGLALATPVPEDDIVTITDTIYKDEYVVYPGKHDITKIVVPLNAINFNENTYITRFDGYVFFIEDGKLYVLKNGQATKLLDNGKDIAASSDESTQVFLAATDGIYTFNPETNTAEKYGTLTDNIKDIVVTNVTDEIFILTEDSTFYKVLDEGTKKEEVTNVKDAQQVVLDNVNNLYFVDAKNRIYVKNYKTNVVKKVKGLSLNRSFVEILTPPALIDDGVPVIIGKKVYGVNPDGTSEFAHMILANKPTASSIETCLYLYIAYDKKIYKLNVLDIADQEDMQPLKSFLNNKSPNLKETAKKKTLRQ